jgi:hypothetical protein
MTRITGLVATILMVGVGTFLFSPRSMSAISGAPLSYGTMGSRFQDTVSPDSFAPDLERAFRQFQARHPPGAQVQAAIPAQINLIFTC